MDGEPVQIRGLRAGLQDVVELEEAAAGMVEHTIEHDVYAAAVGFIEQETKCPAAAQERVDAKIIVRVVAVVGSGLEDGVEIDGVDPQVLQIVQALQHAQQVAPFEAVHRRFGVPGLQITRFGERRAERKAVGKDLVKDGVFYPVGRLENGSHFCLL